MGVTLMRNVYFKTVSLIVTTYNQEAHLSLVLDSILHLVVFPNEVLIADDGSEQSTALLIKSYVSSFKQKGISLKHIWQEDSGFRVAKSRNNAILEARGEYIVIIDTDTILSPLFIYDHLYFAHPKVLLQGGRIFLTQQESQKILSQRDLSLTHSKRSYKNYRNLALAYLVYKCHQITRHIFQKKTMIKGVRSANMSFSKKDFLAIDGFNENFIGWGREDSEFVARFLFNQGVMKILKFCAITYHVCHKENKRDLLQENHIRYLQTLQKQRISWRESKTLSYPS
ncbi:glycosyltransferase [Helicobacter suis]|uniref:Glycosyl transferase family 2 n=1 Tax=Helicobacter suis TaxID=104628 RepID=A0A6J4CZQ3_9HELI|nr:glycosyltransferase [Helicobacter suis]BCD46645.1 hypothetical protein NHP190020_16840 [Helicobacter suis]BCD47447.1 hypothetical protein NHP194003_06510 [Helicobacter suis]BCD49202.1 hypothetical protein NHP194004_06490 [Helicobacter suis]BCD51234.1 hypothetical protein NHP194022_09050 [Helicobacter suis]BCD70978.1 hypothetical protein SNTW_16230 [Helicobacter suis]